MSGCRCSAHNLASDTTRLPRVSSPTGELSTDTLTQQPARMTPQAPTRLPLPQQSAPWTPQRLEVERTEVPEHRDNHHEAQNQGGRRHQCPLAKRGRPRFQYFAPPRFSAACQRSDPSEGTQPCLLAPFIHQEVLNRHLAHCPLLSLLVLRCARLAGRSHLMSSQRGFSVRRRPGTAI